VGSLERECRGTQWAWLLHPFLIATYFVLTLASANLTALRGWWDLAAPATISVGFCTLSWAAAFLLTRSAPKASLLALLWVIAFSVFGYVVEALRPSGALTYARGESGLGFLFVVASLGPSLTIGRTSRNLESVSRYLTLVSVVLVGYTTWQVSRGMDDPAEALLPLLLPPTRADAKPVEDPPDIYLIVLDKYSRSDVLSRHFGFDNSTFETFLRSRGFLIPRRARANYPRTRLALASMLNLDYLQKLPSTDRLDDLIDQNRMAAFLKRHGYRFVFFPTPFKFTSHNRQADVELPPSREVAGEFRASWERTTLLPELVRGGCALLGCTPGRLRLTPETADLMDWKFERLGDLPGGRQPIFVLAHLVLPHEPFLYRADCTHREPYWPANAGMVGDQEADRGYLDQISCTNRKLERLIGSLLARSRRTPIVLLQADHGHGRIGRLPELKYVDQYRLEERLAVFSAYLLPGVADTAISDSISPVNVMRFVLRHYLDANLPPVEDTSYWSSEDRELELQPVTR
jgi:hypothetical protein